MTTAQVELPPKLRPIFLGQADVRGAYGGRGSGKTRTFAMMTAIRAYQWAANNSSGIILCGRQFMNSLADSSMEEIKAAIRSQPWLAPHFDIGEKYIRTADHLPGRIDYAFSGLDRNIDSIKSKARIRLAWIDEAEPVAEVAWAKLIPTIREEDSELWVTWNPERPDSPTHKRFREATDPRMKVVEVNWCDNPWFPKKLDRDRLKDAADRPDTYHHIWDGGFLTISDAQVLKGRFKSEEFTPYTADGQGRPVTKPGWNGPYFGADWGFSVDPTVLVKCWVDGRKLYIEREAYGHEVAIDNTPALFDQIPGSREHVIRADNARPETINFVQRHGFPRCIAADKWPGSVEDGVEHLRSYEQIIIHPNCPHAFREAGLWSYKTDRLTKDVLPVLATGDDHCLVGSTLVDTEHGQIPIEALVGKTGYLWTECDGQPVLRKFHGCRQTSNLENVYRVQFADGSSVTATAEHLIMTRNGWVPALGLKDNDIVLDIADAIRYNVSAINGDASCKFDQRQCTTDAIVSREMIGLVITDALYWAKGCIATFTKWRTATFHQDIIFTTSMGIEATTGLKTCKPYLRPSINGSIGPKITKIARRAFARMWSRLARQPATGTQARLAGIGIGNTQSLSLPSKNQSLQNANIALLNTPAKSRCDFARMLANLLLAEPAARITSRGNALVVEITTARADTLGRRHAAVHAGAKWRRVESVTLAGREAVYNLEVEGEHSFSVAGGVIVHNCWDAVRYALAPMIKRRSPAVVRRLGL